MYFYWRLLAIYLNPLPNWQNFPSKPSLHLHVSGATHSPPFRHLMSQTAVKVLKHKIPFISASHWLLPRLKTKIFINILSIYYRVTWKTHGKINTERWDTILSKQFEDFFTFYHSFSSPQVKRNKTILTRKWMYGCLKN